MIRILLLGGLLLLGGCVNLHVYFPEAAAETASTPEPAGEESAPSTPSPSTPSPPTPAGEEVK